jgi:hypothetical protein
MKPNQPGLFSNENGTPVAKRFDVEAVRQSLAPYNGTATSKAAARSIEPVMGMQQRQVLAAIKSATFGLTREEVADLTGLSDSAVRPRVVELMRARYIVERGERPTKSGRAGKVLWAADRVADEGKGVNQ